MNIIIMNLYDMYSNGTDVCRWEDFLRILKNQVQTTIICRIYNMTWIRSSQKEMFELVALPNEPNKTMYCNKAFDLMKNST